MNTDTTVQNKPAKGHRTCQHYRGNVVSVMEIHCSGHDAHLIEQEVASEYGFSFNRSGVFLKRIERREFIADPNQILYWNKGVSYSVTHPVSGGDICTVLCVREDVLRDSLRCHSAGTEDSDGYLFVRPVAISSRDTVLLHRRLVAYCRALPEDDLLIEETALTLCDSALRSLYACSKCNPARFHQTHHAHVSLVERTKERLNADYRDNIRLEPLARDVASSAFHLARVFKRIVGVTIHEYLTRLRLNAALEALDQGAVNLTALALDLGFSSHGHFSTVFRAKNDMTPSDYRKAVRHPFAI